MIQQADAVSSTFGRRNLEPATAVYQGDKIVTGPIGEAQLRFRDQTKMVVGPNSQLVVDNFVYAGNGTATDVSINAVRGTFRFITGSSAKNAYTLKTPVATIGVRGTQFDFSVEKNGQTNFVLYEGGATLCAGGSCLTMTGGCGVAVVPPGGVPRKVGKKQRDAILGGSFPYLQNQAVLQRGFRTDVSSCPGQKAEIQVVPTFDGFQNGGGNGGAISGVFTTQAAAPPPSPPPPSPPPPSPPSCGPGGGWHGHEHEHGGYGGDSQ